VTFLEINEDLNEFANKMSFKESTQERDIILLISEQSLMWAFVNKIEKIEEDGRNLMIVKLLSIPPIEVHFRLDDDQLHGNKSFEMDIKTGPVFIKAVNFDIITGIEIEEVYARDDIKNNKFAESIDNMIIDGNDSLN